MGLDALEAAKQAERAPLEREVEELADELNGLACDTLTDPAEQDACHVRAAELDDALMGANDGVEVLDRCLLAARSVDDVTDCVESFDPG